MKTLRIFTFAMLVVFGFTASAMAVPQLSLPAGSGSGETTLQGVLDAYTDAGLMAVGDQSGIGLWNESEGAIDSYLVTLIAGDSGQLGLFSGSTNEEFLFAPNALQSSFRINDDGGLIVNGVEEFSSGWDTFGFFWYNSSQEVKSYTANSKNVAGGVNYGYSDEDVTNAMALSYLVPAGSKVTTQAPNGKTDTITALPKLNGQSNDWILAFEDRPYVVDGTDWEDLGKGDGDFNDAVFYIEDIQPVPEPATMVLLGLGLIGLGTFGRKKGLFAKKA